MFANQINNGTVNFSSFDSLDQELIATLTKSAHLISQFGYKVKVYSPRSLKKLSEISADKKLMTISRYSKLIEWISSEEVFREPNDIEIICVKKALEYFKLKADESFLETITHDQIIEIYGDDMVQLYRSFNFFNVTGYSLLDMTVYEWYVLWERPSTVINETLRDTEMVLSEYVPVKPFTVTSQPIKEVYDTGEGDVAFGFIPRAISATFGNVGSLRSLESFDPRPKGFICTSKANFITIGDNASNLRLI